MELSEYIRQIENMYCGDDSYCEYGCSENDIELMIQRCKEIAPDMYYCTIADWVWIDINYTVTSYLKEYHERELKPCFVRSSQVLFDEAQRPHIRDSVRSTALIEFYENCIFRTLNTMYILVGKGSRVSVEAEVLQSMIDW